MVLGIYGSMYLENRVQILNITENGLTEIQSALPLIIRPMTTCSGHWQVGCLSGHAMKCFCFGPIQMDMRP